MAAPKGNNFNTKWKTPEERKAACDAVCQHIASGLSQQSFDLSDWDTVERYCKDFPEDFPAEKIAAAFRAQRAMWERLGMQGAKGEVANFNATAWIFNMKNRFRAEWNDTIKSDHTSSDGSMTPQVVERIIIQAKDADG